MDMILHIDCAAPMPLGQYLRRQAGLSAHMLRRLKTVGGGMTRGGETIRSVDLVAAGDTVRLHFPECCGLLPNPALSVPVVYETASLLVCDKPAGMPAHPSAGHRDDTLGNWFAAYAPDCGFHLLNRLDKNTSGLCLAAKSAHAAQLLQGRVQKTYLALLPPGLSGSGAVDLPIGREDGSVIRRCVTPEGKPALTRWRILRTTPRCALAALTLGTGRTHQIRVHMAALGYPLLGDDLYGGDCTEISAHALHCAGLRFPDPDTGRTVSLTAPLRPEMQRLLKK